MDVLAIAARRLLIAIPLLLGITAIAFLILNHLPGDVARQLLGAEATPQQIAALQARLHLDQTVWERYAHWLGRAVAGDLGRSFRSDQPVSVMLSERLPVTLELTGYAFVLSLGLAVPAALLAARNPGRLLDRLTLLLSMVGLSAANYVLALVLILVLAVHAGWFPAIGFAPLSRGPLANLRSLTLPALALALPLASLYLRFLRGDLVAQLQGEDYVITAIAKGVPPWKVLLRHALPNSLFGLLTLVGVNFGVLIGGAVIVEQIFSLPGVGQLLLQAINGRDVTVVQAVVMLLTAITVLANLLVDLLYMMLDPRLRRSHA